MPALFCLRTLKDGFIESGEQCSRCPNQHKPDHTASFERLVRFAAKERLIVKIHLCENPVKSYAQ